MGDETNAAILVDRVNKSLRPGRILAHLAICAQTEIVIGLGGPHPIVHLFAHQQQDLPACFRVSVPAFYPRHP
jgi:hypothetical protein